MPVNDIVHLEDLLNKINTLESGDYCYIEVKNLLESSEVAGNIYFKLDIDFNIELI